MRIKGFFLSFIFSVFGLSFWPMISIAAPSGPAAEGVTLSEDQWAFAQARFEKDTAELTTWLEKYENRKKALTAEITNLQDKTSQLRSETRDQPNVFKEFRLKELLNELKDKLQENSDLDHETDLKQKDFEEKCLSLIDLYNTRIEIELEQGEVNAPSAQLDSKIKLLSGLVRKRNQIQMILKRYRRSDDKEKLALMGAVSSMKTNNKETLQLTLGLFKDRQKNLQDQLEKWMLEMDGLRNELKLQGEMKDFLKDIQNMNANASFPQGNLKQEDLDFLSWDNQKKKLFIRLNEVQQKISKGQKSLAQIERLLTEVQERLDSPRKGKKP